ncbi:retrovirus-related pol polyprotein from transposon TNT 1-94 [Tanacetum coccineum]
MNVPYDIRMIPEPVDTQIVKYRSCNFHAQPDDELTLAKLNRCEKTDDQAIQTILLGHPEDIYDCLLYKMQFRIRFQIFVIQNGQDLCTEYWEVNVVAARAEGNTPGNNGNQIRCYNCRGLGHLARNCTVRPRRRDAAYLQTQLLIAQKEEAGIQLQAEEFDLMAAAADLDEIEEVNANCILMANLQQASTSGTQTDNAPVYDSDGSAEVHNYDNCYDNEIFNMFTQEEQYTELLEPIPEPHQVQQNDSNVISDISSVEQEGGTVDQHPATVEETRAYFESLYNNLALEVEKLSTEKSTVSSLLEEKKKLKSDFKIREDELLDKQIQLENKIKELLSENNKRLYNGKVLLEKHDPPVVHDSEETMQLAQESRQKMKQLNKEIKPANYTKINLLSGIFVSQMAKSQEEVTTPITVSQPHVVTKKDVNSDSNGLSSTGVDNTAKTRRPQPRSNTKNDRVHSASKSSCNKNKEVEVEEHHRNLLLSKNKKHMSSECKHVKLDIRNDKSEVVCAMCKQCLITANHDVCMLNYVNDMNSRARTKANVSKLKSKNNKPKGCSKHMTGNLKLLINFVWKFLGTVRFGNDHVAAILGFGDLQWGNILITRVYFVEGLGHNLFSVGQFCDSDLEVAFRRNSCFVRNLDGVDLLQGNRSTNLYTINLHEMASASPICLMARASSTKSWLWHQRLSHLNFDTINDLAKNDLVSGLPKFKYQKEHLCPSCEQGKSKRASHPPKPVPNSKRRLHLLHMDLCGPMRIASINGKRYVLVIVDDYSRYTWVHFLRSKDEAPEVIFLRSKDEAPKEIRTFLKKITILLQAPVIIVRTENGTEFKNQVLQEYFNSVGISHQASSVRTPQQNRVVKRRNRMLVEAARRMLIFSHAPLFLWAEAIATACYTQNRSIILRQFDKTPKKLINGRKPDISFLHVFGALCYPKNDREDIGKLGAKAMAFEQSSLKPGLQSMTSGQISSGLDLAYVPSTITTQQPSEGELDLLFESMYDDHICGQLSATPRTVLAAQAPKVLQTPKATTTSADTAPTPTNSSSQATNFPNTSPDVDKLETQQQHVQHQPASIADNVSNVMFDENTFVNPFATPSTSAVESSSSQYVDPSNMHTFYQPHLHEYQ